VLERSHRSRWLDDEHLPWLLVLAGLLALYVPTGFDLASGIWATDQQSHGPLVLALSVWLMWRQWPAMSRAEPASPASFGGWFVLVLGALLYALGRSQGILGFEVASLIVNLAGCVLVLRGPRRLRLVWFALFFMCFMVPLPSGVVDTLTQPMKLAVSYAAEALLHTAGYPISRTGVVIQIGPYQLLVADACAGLHTLFALEAMGLLYLNVVRSSSLFRNVALAILVVPISFTANVIRVVVLTLITYHLGDAAGQGFLHGFAGMVLFLTALALIIATDSLLRVASSSRCAGRAA